MSASAVQYPGLVDNFAGEHRGIAEHRLPPGVSPDALNMEYREGRLRPRGGVLRMHETGELRGGLVVRDTLSGTTAGEVRIAHQAWHVFSGDWEVELMVAPFWGAGGLGTEVFVLRKCASLPAAEGFALSLFNDSGIYKFKAYVGDTVSGGMPVMHSVVLEEGRVYSVSLRYDVSALLFELVVDGVAVQQILTAGYLGSTALLALGHSAGSMPNVFCVVDELRLWTSLAPVSLHTVRRELTSAEITAAVAGYWRFSVGSWTPSGNLRLFPDLRSGGQTATAYPLATDARGLVYGEDNLGVLTGLMAIGPSEGLLVGTRSDVLLWSPGGGLTHLLSTEVSEGRWQHCRSMGWTIFCNGAGPNFRYRADLGIRQLSFDAPSTVVTGSPGGTGGLSAGVYRYQFSFVDADAEVESATGLFVTSVTAAGGDEITLPDLPHTGQRGVTHVRIYRTLAGGSVYYWLADVALGVVSYVDDAADSTLSEVLDVYTGFAGPASVVFEHRGSVFAGCFLDAPSRLQFTEPGRVGAFYAENYLDLIQGDTEPLTGGLSVNGLAVVFKRRSVWIITGDGPESYAPVLAYRGLGCVCGATIGASASYVYYLNAKGVARLPVGGGPPELISVSQDVLFEGFEASSYGLSSGLWDADRQRYLVTFVVGGETRTLAFYEGTGVWQLWDLAAQDFATLEAAEGPQAVYVAWRGYVGLLEGAVSEGVQVDDAAALDVRGVATGGSLGTLVDSGAAWPVDGLWGVDVSVLGEDGVWSTRRVWSNTGTTLLVTPAWDEAPGAGAVYVLGARSHSWRTPWLSFGDPFDARKLERLRVLFQRGQGAYDVPVVVTDSGGAVAARVFDASSRFGEALTGEIGGKEFWVGVSDFSPDAGWVLDGIGLGVSDRRSRGS